MTFKISGTRFSNEILVFVKSVIKTSGYLNDPILLAVKSQKVFTINLRLS